jgi:hypothetical protein
MKEIVLTVRQAELLGPIPEGTIDWDQLAFCKPRVLETIIPKDQPPFDVRHKVDIQSQHTTHTCNPSIEGLGNDGDICDEDFMGMKRKRRTIPRNTRQNTIENNNLHKEAREGFFSTSQQRNKIRKHHKQKRLNSQKTILESYGLPRHS